MARNHRYSRGRPRNREYCRGHTLLELLITVIVAATLAAVGIPALGEWRRGSRLDATAQLLMTHLQAARIHAVTSSVDVMICPGTGGCVDGDWSTGWTVFEDVDGDRRRDPGELPLLEHRLSESLTLAWRRRPSWLFYRHTGIGWPNGTFRICTRHDGRPGAAVVVSGSGRPRFARETELRPCFL